MIVVIVSVVVMELMKVKVIFFYIEMFLKFGVVVSVLVDGEYMGI